MQATAADLADLAEAEYEDECMPAVLWGTMLLRYCAVAVLHCSDTVVVL
jgi:hypothetical protein